MLYFSKKNAGTAQVVEPDYWLHSDNDMFKYGQEYLAGKATRTNQVRQTHNILTKDPDKYRIITKDPDEYRM